MRLDLEVIGPARDLTEGEVPVRAPARIAKLRESHHAVARLVARGLAPGAIESQTGVRVTTIYRLIDDPSFQELVAVYRRDQNETAQQVEALFLGLALEARAQLHEDLIERGEEIAPETKLDILKVAADRAGYAPVQRNVNKNLNLNIGARLDAARRELEGKK